jgi:methyl-accepting chemotaxis protein
MLIEDTNRMATSTPDALGRTEDDRSLRHTLADVVNYIPRGESLPQEAWEKRHRNILLLLLAHVPFLFALGTFTGTDPYVTGAEFTAVPLEHAVGGVGIVAALAGVAWWPGLPRRVRASVAAVGLMTSSAVLVYFSGGFIEAHFHFFVVAGVIASYEDYLPFAVGIAFVAIEHSLFGMANPEAVYNHPAAVANPMGWGFVHAVFLLGLCAALVSNWLSIERSREETRQQIQNVKDSEEAKAEVEELNRQLVVQADELATAMDAVSKGDFTAEPPRQTDIEAIAAISDAFVAMKRELSATIVDLREFATSVERTTRSVHDDAETLEQAQQQLASDVRAFATDVRNQASNLESTTGELSNLSATIEEIAANADQVSNEAGTAADAADAGTDTAEAAVEAIEHIERSVGELAALVDSLDTRMDEVSESTDLIESIAEQTNTLALNANIEAARAVNDSEGFAVVADEVKSLADETQDHSAAISLTIGDTIEDVKRVQREMEQTKAQIETGKETTADAGAAFTDLSTTVEGVDVSVTEVAAATDDGARTTEEVVDAITRVADQARSVAEQSESLADRAETRASTISDVRSQLDDLTSQTGDLQNQLDAFTCEPTGN